MSKKTKTEPSDSPCEDEVFEEEKIIQKEVIDYWQFVEYSRLCVGDKDYKSDPAFWETQFKRDYETINERLEMERKIISGELTDINVDLDLEDLSSFEFFWEKLGGLRVLTLEQFILESNQGIFREDRFYCDKGRAWMKKVVKLMAQHGFNHVRKVEVEGLPLLEISKNQMGVV